MDQKSKVSNGSLIVAGVLTLLILVIIVGLIVIALVPPKNLTEIDVREWFKGKKPKCSTDNECYKECRGKTGCCARCVNNRCETGALTQQGCMISSGTGKSDDDKNDNMTAHGNYQMNMPPNLSFPPGVGAPQCTNDQDAYLSKCTGDDSNSSCCAICTSGLSFSGIKAPDGSCQTTASQSGFPGMGLQPPNTYVVSSSGPKFGISMGSCTVKPITSSVVNYTGFFDSCLPGTAPADYSGPGSYSANYSSCG